MADEITATVHTEIAEIDPSDWNACAAGVESFSQDLSPNPFVTHEFLHALEKSQCVGAHTGWHPAHIAIRDAKERVLGVCPAYVKSHSQGEYVFDYGWADAFERAGGQYYPKIQVSVPFTPVTGPRLMIRGTDNAAEQRMLLAGALMGLCEQANASSVHVTFAAENDINALEKQGFLLRNDIQYHWLNEDFAGFEAFLETLASRKRKSIRRERRAASEHGISFEWISGSDLREHHWDAFFRFYIDTGGRKWGDPYLNRKFFSLLGEAMAGKIVLIFAMQNGEPVAGALNLIGGNTLYGRYWGTTIDQPFLHFETCYYQAMDYAIQHGIKWVEAGAQGQHKLTRGYRPVVTGSAHFIRHPGLRDAIENYLARERPAIAGEAEALANYLPFKKVGGEA